MRRFREDGNMILINLKEKVRNATRPAPRVWLWLGGALVLAGIGFGGFLILIAQVPREAVFVPLLVARAVARLDRLMRLSFELLIDNGTLLALKGRDAAGELEALGPTQAAAVELLSVPAPGEPR